MMKNKQNIEKLKQKDVELRFNNLTFDLTI
jgi:hypothetical protein